MSAHPNCPACHGRGGWEDPDEGQFVTCNCEANMKHLGERRRPLPPSELDRLEDFVQLHQTVEIVYVVDGYHAKYMIQDGQVCERTAKGGTILEALRLLEASLSERPPKYGGPKGVR